MNWNLGYSAAYYAAIIDKATWRDVERIEITGGSISRTDSGLLHSASIDCVEYGYTGEQWMRIYLDAKQGETSVHIPLYTGLVCTPSRKINGNLQSHTLTGYSVLKPAEDILLDRGWYAPAETNGAVLVSQLLKVTPAPIEMELNAPMLQDAIIAEDGETNLSMAEKILTAINWRLRITGDGIIHIEPKATSSVALFEPVSDDSIEPEIEVEDDWFGCPNVFRAISDELTGVARDDSERSSLSTVNRGREVWMEETASDINDGETIAEYAMRRLKEEQQHASSAKYDRRFRPDVYPTDLIDLRYPAQGLQGTYKVISQSIELGHGARTSEEVVKV